MEKQTAIVVGLGALAVAAIGGLGWKAAKARQNTHKQSQDEQERRKAELRARQAERRAQQHVQQVAVEEIELTRETACDNMVLHAVIDLAEGQMDLTPEEEPVNDIVSEIITDSGESVVSVARARVPEVRLEPDQTPMFWTSFVGKIRRPDVIELSSGSFAEQKGDLAKGYHKCTVDGVAGILHVTKSNATAVIHMGGDNFSGISTSGARFGGKGLVNLSVEQVKNFLNGR